MSVNTFPIPAVLSLFFPTTREIAPCANLECNLNRFASTIKLLPHCEATGGCEIQRQRSRLSIYLLF